MSHALFEPLTNSLVHTFHQGYCLCHSVALWQRTLRC